jgi:hypothetical protein
LAIFGGARDERLAAKPSPPQPHTLRHAACDAAPSSARRRCWERARVSSVVWILGSVLTWHCCDATSAARRSVARIYLPGVRHGDATLGAGAD